MKVREAPQKDIVVQRTWNWISEGPLQFESNSQCLLTFDQKNCFKTECTAVKVRSSWKKAYAPVTRFDAFISYRRSDGAPAARWLRRALRRYRLPRSLRSDRKPKLSVFLDTLYARGATDFYEQTILPALQTSNHLIVIATPNAAHRSDEDWVAREIDDFISTRDPQKVYVVRALGKDTDPVPGNLLQRYPRIQIIDLRGAGTWTAWFPSRANQLREGLLEIVASLHGISLDEMPRLRAEETSRQRMRIGLGIGFFAAVSALSVAVSLNAVQRQAEGQAAIDESLSATTRIVRTVALGTGEARIYDREPNDMLLGACVVARRLATSATTNLDPASEVACDLEAALQSAATLPSDDTPSATETLLKDCIAGPQLAEQTDYRNTVECTAKTAELAMLPDKGLLRATVAAEFARLGKQAQALLLDSAGVNPEEMGIRAHLAYAALRFENRVLDVDRSIATDREVVLLERIVSVLLGRDAAEGRQEHDYHLEALNWQNALIDSLVKRARASPQADYRDTQAAIQRLLAQMVNIGTADADTEPWMAALFVQSSGHLEQFAHLVWDRGDHEAAASLIAEAKFAMQTAIDWFPDHPEQTQWRYWQADYEGQLLQLMKLRDVEYDYVSRAMATIAAAKALGKSTSQTSELGLDIEHLRSDVTYRLHQHLDATRRRIRLIASEGDSETALRMLESLIGQTSALYRLNERTDLWARYYVQIARAEQIGLLAASGAPEEAEAFRPALYADMRRTYDPGSPDVTPGNEGEFVSTFERLESDHFSYLVGHFSAANDAASKGDHELAITHFEILRAARRNWSDALGTMSDFDHVYWAETSIPLAKSLEAIGRFAEARRVRVEALGRLLPIVDSSDLTGDDLRRGQLVWRSLSSWAAEVGLDLETIDTKTQP